MCAANDGVLADMTLKPYKILVVYHQPFPDRFTRLTMVHHIHTLDRSPIKHDILYHNTIGGLLGWFKTYPFDAIILHYSFLAVRFSPKTRFELFRTKTAWLKDWPGLKIAIPQDEYDRHALLDDWLMELGVLVVFSCFKGKQIEQLYPQMSRSAEFRQCLTGYIHTDLIDRYKKSVKPIAERTVDIVYRARDLPFRFGSHGRKKHLIAHVVKTAASQAGLICDISTSLEDTISGEDWIDFLASGKAVLGTEGGASALDPYGDLKQSIDDLLDENPELSFEEVSAALPQGWDNYEFAAPGPRILEAALTKTCQILMEGMYGGILEPENHYFSIKSNYSNLNEILDKIRDVKQLQAMADRTYEDVVLSGRFTYRAFAQQIEVAIENGLFRGQIEDPPAFKEYFYRLLNIIYAFVAVESYRSLMGSALIAKRVAPKLVQRATSIPWVKKISKSL